jgi:hypothetical protein
MQPTKSVVFGQILSRDTLAKATASLRLFCLVLGNGQNVSDGIETEVEGSAVTSSTTWKQALLSCFVEAHMHMYSDHGK